MTASELNQVIDALAPIVTKAAAEAVAAAANGNGTPKATPAPKAGRNGKGQFVGKVKATPTVTAPEAVKAPRVITIADPGAAATFRQRKMIAKLTGTFPKGDLTKGQASEMITAALAA